MSELISWILTGIDWYGAAEFASDALVPWTVTEIDQCVEAGLITRCPPAQRLRCLECASGPLLDLVELQNDENDQKSLLLFCPECGPVTVGAERLGRWWVDLTELVTTIANLAGARGQREELQRETLWRLGHARWAGRSWNLYFARALHQRNAVTLFERCGVTPQSVVLVPAFCPRGRQVTTTQLIVPLDTLLNVEESRLQFDHNVIVDQLQARRESRSEPAARPRRRRASRTAAIDLLTRALSEHVRSARDHAAATADLTGTPHLLPRPSRRELARSCGVTEMSTSRCFHDESARELRFLWDLAGDLERLLDYLPQGRPANS